MARSINLLLALTTLVLFSVTTKANSIKPTIHEYIDATENVPHAITGDVLLSENTSTTVGKIASADTSQDKNTSSKAKASATTSPTPSETPSETSATSTPQADDKSQPKKDKFGIESINFGVGIGF